MIATFNSGATIAAGIAFKDTEIEYVGQNKTPCCRFAIIVGKEPGEGGGGGKGVFLNCKAWRALAEIAGAIRKGDSVAVMGKMTSYKSPKNGVTYKTLDVEWIDVKSKSFMLAKDTAADDAGEETPLFDDEEEAFAEDEETENVKLPWEENA